MIIMWIIEFKEDQKLDVNVLMWEYKWVIILIYRFYDKKWIDYQLKLMASIDRNLIAYFPYWLKLYLFD